MHNMNDTLQDLTNARLYSFEPNSASANITCSHSMHEKGSQRAIDGGIRKLGLGFSVPCFQPEHEGCLSAWLLKMVRARSMATAACLPAAQKLSTHGADHLRSSTIPSNDLYRIYNFRVINIPFLTIAIIGLMICSARLHRDQTLPESQRSNTFHFPTDKRSESAAAPSASWQLSDQKHTELSFSS